MSKKSSLASGHGVFLCHKPSGTSSNGALQKVKRALKLKKAGHTGALDPLATGVLPLCFGEATKFSQFGLESVKCYRVKAQFGVVTETGDSDGDICETFERPTEVSEGSVRKVIQSFTGVQSQTPHKYSALKYNGRPLYEYARSGIEVPIPAREICISEIVIESIDLESASMQLWVCASKGTYIRSLVQDIGDVIGWGAHVTLLHRTHAGYFNEESCLQVNIEAPEQMNHGQLIPISSLLLGAEWWFVNGSELDKLKNGHAVDLDACSDISYLKGTMVDFYSARGVYLTQQKGNALMRDFYRRAESEKAQERQNLVVLYTRRPGSDIDPLEVRTGEDSMDLSQVLMLRGIVEVKEQTLQPRRMITAGTEVF